MASVSEVLLELIELEERLDLYNESYKDAPIYRIFRFNLRNKYLKKRIPSYTCDSRGTKFVFSSTIKNIIYSIYDISRLFFENRRVNNVIFPHFRLFEIQDKLIEKFTDPLIDYSSLHKSSLIFQQSYRFFYRKKRYNVRIMRQMECLEAIANILSVVLLPVFYLKKNRMLIDKLFIKLKFDFCLARKDAFKLYIHYLRFYILTKIYKSIFKHLHVKNILIVNRYSFMAQIFAAHQLGIIVYELQHGVTMGNTILYSGKFNSVIDPDYFLTFGSLWKGPQFSIPLEKIVNIGFAYKTYVKNLVNKNYKGNKAVLIVSSPAITDNIVCIAELLAIKYTNYTFYIRCHPQEELNEMQKYRIMKHSNITYSEKNIESNLEILSYGRRQIP